MPRYWEQKSALEVVGGTLPPLGGGVWVSAWPVMPTMLSNFDHRSHASAPMSMSNSVLRWPLASMGAAMLPITCQPASATSSLVSRPLIANGGSLSSGGRVGGRLLPLRTIESCGGLWGVGRWTATLPGTFHVRVAWTKPSSAAATSAADSPKNVGIGGIPASSSSPAGLRAICALMRVLPAVASPLTMVSRTKSAGTRSADFWPLEHDENT